MVETGLFASVESIVVNGVKWYCLSLVMASCYMRKIEQFRDFDLRLNEIHSRCASQNRTIAMYKENNGE